MHHCPHSPQLFFLLLPFVSIAPLLRPQFLRPPQVFCADVDVSLPLLLRPQDVAVSSPPPPLDDASFSCEESLRLRPFSASDSSHPPPSPLSSSVRPPPASSSARATSAATCSAP